MLIVHRVAPPSPAQWQLVIDGMRNSWESWERGDSYTDADGIFVLGTADQALALRLVRAGTDHAKTLRQLPVILDVTGPNYWWREFDTYRVGVSADDLSQNSTSQMHTVGREPFRVDMFSFEDMEAGQVATLMHLLNWHRDRWIDEGGRRKGPASGHWRAMLQAIPDSWNYRRTVALNYQAARAIYHARRAHRLSEWRDFCAALASLPHAELITEATS